MFTREPGRSTTFLSHGSSGASWVCGIIGRGQASRVPFWSGIRSVNNRTNNPDNIASLGTCWNHGFRRTPVICWPSDEDSDTC